MSQPLTPAEIAEQLDLLAQFRLEKGQLERACEEDTEALLTSTQKRRRQEIVRRFQSAYTPLAQAIAATEEAIRCATLTLGGSVKGDTLQAIYCRGRVSWDTSALEGFIAAGHPELDPFRRVGAPSVSIREVR